MSITPIEKNVSVSVLIVGGSVVGLSLALFLARQRVPVLLVERHASTSIHPRAGVFNARTMEIFRQAGIESEILALETPPEKRGEAGLHIESLAKIQEATGETFPQRYEQTNPFASPTRNALLGQDKLEPILRKHAAEAGGVLRFGTELLWFEQDSEGVTARIHERATGRESTVRTQYLVAADGNRSGMRQRLGISSYGYGTLGHWVSLIFRADLSSLLAGRKVSLCFVNNTTVEGIMGQAEERWMLFARVKPEAGKEDTPGTISETRCLELIRAAVGLPDQEVELISMLPWELAVRVAERYQQERVFLVGDAAHVMTTMGAFGANTGIADAHNLAWKLAFVLHDRARAALLTSYGPERQTAAELAVAVSTGLYAYRLPGIEQKEAIIQSANEFLKRVQGGKDSLLPTAFSVINGYRYRSGAVLSEEENENGARFENEPSGCPGTRAPHVWLTIEGQTCSLLDLYGTNIVLLTGPEGSRWWELLGREAARRGIPLDTYSIGEQTVCRDNEGTFCSSYGISPSGAVLVRPDGFIAWRAREDSEAETLSSVAMSFL